MIEVFWWVLLVAVVGGACFYAGWRSAASYLNAAHSVANLTNVVAAQSNEFMSHLDKTSAAVASLREAVDQNTEMTRVKQGDVEQALYQLFQGFERAGVVRSYRPTPGPQVGEKRGEQG